MSLKFTQKITLDLTIPRIQNVRCVQDDKNTRFVNITITNNGEPFFVTKDMIVSYKVCKADSNYVWNKSGVTVNDDGTVTVDLSDQAVSVIGIAKSCLKIQENNEKISTLPFNIIVEKAVVSDDVISSSIESDIIDDMENHLVDFNNPHRIPDATITGIKGLTELKDSITSNSKTTAATPNSVKLVKDSLNSEINRATNAEKKLDSNKANIDSPKLTGIPTAPTASVGTNTTQIATTAFVQTAVTTNGGHYIGTSSPSNTNLLWIDTSNSGTLKYYDGTTWVEIAGSAEILDSMQSYLTRAQALYDSMYLDCDGETPNLRVVTLIKIKGGTPQQRLIDGGISFDGGTPTSRLLGA